VKITFLSYYILFSLGDTFLDFNKYIFIYYLVIMAVFIYAVFLIIRSLADRFLNHELPVLLALNYAIIFIATFFYATFLVQEGWFWLITSFVYLVGIIMSCLGLACILQKGFRPWQIVMIIIAFLYVGGANEAYSSVLLVDCGKLILCTGQEIKN